MQHLVWGVLLLPLAGFLINALGMRLPNRIVSIVGPAVVGLAFVCAVLCYYWLWSQPEHDRSWTDIGWHWVLAGRFQLDFGLLLDPLSTVMILVITGVGFLTMVYSVG